MMASLFRKPSSSLLLAICAFLAHPLPAHAVPSAVSPGHNVTHYFTLWSGTSAVSSIPWQDVSQVALSFAGVDTTGQCNWVDDGTQGGTTGATLSTPPYSAVIQAIIAARNANNPNVMLTLSVGGQTLSFKFSDAVANDPYKLASSCVSMINDLGLDGIDYDWEYPTKFNYGSCPSGVTACSRTADKANFTTLLQNTRSLLTSSTPMGSAAPLSAAVAYGTQYYDVPGMDAQLTTWNVMAYEFGGCWSGTTQNNAPISSSINALAAFASAGATKTKLVLGVPYYSNWFSGASSNSVGASFSSCSTVTYSDIYTHCSSSSCSVSSSYVNGSLDSKTCYCSNDGTWATFDDASVMSAKAAAVTSGGYGGILVWSIPGDYQNTLTNSIYEVLRPADAETSSSSTSSSLAMTLADFVAIIP